ncbi:MAG: hypothetical protein OEM62_04635 [Acidobacteriota bacterium]|nr:hypothetical protein [Acidobacteriota bacterium]
MRTVSRVFAVDWSGDRKAARRKIWLCEVAGGEVRRLENGRTRDEVAACLIDEATRDSNFAVGFDFAFSFPAAFLEKRAHHRIETVWGEASLLGEAWLEHCPFPFWGKPGKKKPLLGSTLMRRTEIAVAEESGLAPMSVFQIGGAGAVGVGSLRGMPVIQRLREAGFSIWPFDVPSTPLVVEIWPRLFMGTVKKSSRQERRLFLRRRYPTLDSESRRAAEDSDDAFDALVAALEMSRHREEFTRLEQLAESPCCLEGEIWHPRQEVSRLD